LPSDLVAQLDRPLFEQVSLVDVDDLTDEQRTGLPSWWLDVAGTGRDGVERALSHWEATLSGLLPKFRQWVDEAGVDVFIGRSASVNKSLLAYVLAGESEQPVCWYGFPPNAQLHNASLDLGKLPTTLRRFYADLHDGFKQASTFHNGFPASGLLFPVSQEGEEEDFEFLGSDARPDLDKLVPIFFDYGAASICAELSDDPDSRAGWRWSEGSLKPYEDIWEMLDNWMVAFRD
jgi:hypothetical protein